MEGDTKDRYEGRRPEDGARTGEGALNAHTPEGAATEDSDLRARERDVRERVRREPTRTIESEGLKEQRRDGTADRR
jgi:hypothetical protein